MPPVRGLKAMDWFQVGVRTYTIRTGRTVYARCSAASSIGHQYCNRLANIRNRLSFRACKLLPTVTDSDFKVGHLCAPRPLFTKYVASSFIPLNKSEMDCFWQLETISVLQFSKSFEERVSIYLLGFLIISAIWPIIWVFTCIYFLAHGIISTF